MPKFRPEGYQFLQQRKRHPGLGLSMNKKVLKVTSCSKWPESRRIQKRAQWRLVGKPGYTIKGTAHHAEKLGFDEMLIKGYKLAVRILIGSGDLMHSIAIIVNNTELYTSKC